MSPYRHYVRRYTNVVAFMVLALSVFISVGVSSRQQRDTLGKVCESNAEVRKAIRDLVSAQPADMATPPGADPALADAIAEANRRSADSRQAVDRMFADPPCAAELSR